jgi:predicted ATPase
LTGSRKSLAEYHGFLGEIHWRANRPREASSELDTALKAAEQSNNRCYEAELLRLKGEVLRLDHRGVARAEQYFRKSLEVARRQKSLSWELRTATSLARLLRDQQKTAEALSLMTGIYQQFDQGFSTPDLQDAKTLIGELST